MKTCKVCKIKKNEQEFELSYSLKNPTNRRKQCKKCRNKQRNLYESRYGDGLRERNLKKFYNMSREDYLLMSSLQDNKCFICEKINNFGPWKDKLVVDHCHKSGKIRKLLCDKCNKGLGQFDDSPELLKKAANYIQLFKV